MKYEIIFSSLTLLSIIICKIDCAEYLCDNFGISEKSGPGEEDSNCGEDNVCCNSNILQVMRETFDQANNESYQDTFKKLLKSFKILNTEIKALDVYIHKRRDGEVIYNALQYAACNVIKEPESMTRLDGRVISTLKNTKCICNHPIVKNLVEERAESLMNLYTKYNDGLFQLRELMTKIKFVEKGNLEDELVDKLLKAVVCKQCSGQKIPICMSECHELINLGMTFEAKKLQLLEGIVKLTQAGFEQVSKLFEELSLEFENAKQSVKESIIAELLEGTDFNHENCEEINENDITDVGASCSTLPSKCNPANTATCTINNCKDQCKVNCCNKDSQKKCTIPTCIGCKGTAAATCQANTANNCAGITEKQSKFNVEKITELFYTIQDQIEESKRNLGSHDVGASCSTLPSKCNPANTATCTINNCKDQCKVNCCNKDSQKKCTIPTCIGCKGTAAATCQANTDSKCAGITEKQSKINVEKITELFYTIQDQIEESKRNLGSHGRYICQQLMETHEDVNLIRDSNEREFGGDFDYILNEEFSEEQMQYYSDANQPMDDALEEFSELGVF